jgi:hypothetical protein
MFLPKILLLLENDIKFDDVLNFYKFVTMETLIVHSSPEKLKSLKAFLKAMDIDFEKSPYKQPFVAKIKKAQHLIKDGKGVKVSLDQIWK